MSRKFATPPELVGPEHNCFPLHVGGKLVATCGRHYGQQPVPRNGGLVR